MEELRTNRLAWGAAGMPLEGNAESGDQHVCLGAPQGALIALIDALGHGPEAAAVAKEACRVLQSSEGENVITLIRRCHERLKGTRGAAMSLATFNFADSLLTWIGVGNVRGVLLPRDGSWSGREESLLLRPGVVGSQLPPLQAAVVPLSPGDMVLLWTDGIEENFDRASVLGSSPQQAAEHILERHAKRSDDALIFIARYKRPVS